MLVAFTTWLNTGEVAPPKFAVAAYTTVIESVPEGRLLVASVAVLLAPLPAVRATVPSAVDPFINTTEPVGAEVLLEIVAVSVTGWPAFAGFNEEITAAVVLLAFTTWLKAVEVEPPKFAVAAYTAVTGSVPTGSVVNVSVAVLVRLPLGDSVAVPSVVEPLMNVTDPVGAA